VREGDEQPVKAIKNAPVFSTHLKVFKGFQYNLGKQAIIYVRNIPVNKSPSNVSNIANKWRILLKSFFPSDLCMKKR